MHSFRVTCISVNAVVLGSGEVEHHPRDGRTARVQRDTHAPDYAAAFCHGCSLDLVSHSRQVEIDPRWIRQRFGQRQRGAKPLNEVKLSAWQFWQAVAPLGMCTGESLADFGVKFR